MVEGKGEARGMVVEDKDLGHTAVGEGRLSHLPELWKG
jgi:hypothetical protein